MRPLLFLAPHHVLGTYSVDYHLLPTWVEPPVFFDSVGNPYENRPSPLVPSRGEQPMVEALAKLISVFFLYNFFAIYHPCHQGSVIALIQKRDLYAVVQKYTKN